MDGGREPATGLDCWGLVLAVRARMGLYTPDYTESAFNSEAVGRAALVGLASGDWVDCQPGPGAVVLMALDSNLPGVIQHFGVCLDKRTFIQIIEEHGVQAWPLDHPFFKHRIKGFVEWKPGR